MCAAWQTSASSGWQQRIPRRWPSSPLTAPRSTRAELAAMANRIANGLQALGLKPDDVLALVLPNSIEMVAAFLAGTQIGLTSRRSTTTSSGPRSPTSCATPAPGRCSATTASPTSSPRWRPSSATTCRRRSPSATSPASGPCRSCSTAQPDTPPADRVAGAPMHYTSGTTGKPKGVKRGRVDMDPDELAGLYSMFLMLFGVQPEDGNVHITGSPLYHTAVLLWTANSLHMGHKVVLMDKWQPEEMLRLIDAAQGDDVAHGADAAAPPAGPARGGAGEVRLLVDALHGARRRPVPARGQAQDDRVVGRRGDGVLRRHRGRRHDRHRQGVARAARHRRQGVVGRRDPHLRRRGQAPRPRRDRHRLHGPRPGDASSTRATRRRRRRTGSPTTRPASTSSPSATSASSTTTATCSCATARST